MVSLTHLLDTNICSALIDELGTLHRPTWQQLLALKSGATGISVFVHAEVLVGLKNRPSANRSARYEHVRKHVRLIPLADEPRVAERFSTLRVDLQRRGKAVGLMDMLIAAHAQALDLTLVSHDQDFRYVNDLRLEDWLDDSPPTAAEPGAPYRAHRRPIPHWHPMRHHATPAALPADLKKGVPATTTLTRSSIAAHSQANAAHPLDPARLCIEDFRCDPEDPLESHVAPPGMPEFGTKAWHALFDRFCEATGYDPSTDPEEDRRAAAFDQLLREL